MNSKRKVNTDFLSKQTQMFLKISNYAHFMCLGLFLVFRFILGIDGPAPIVLFVFFGLSLANTWLFRFHHRIVVVSVLFFTFSFFTTILVSLYSGGLNSPFLSVLVVSVIGAYISSLKHGRFFLSAGALGVLLLLLNGTFEWIPSSEFTEFQERYFATFTYVFVFIISSAAGLSIAKISYKGYQAKKEVEKQKLIIEASKNEIEIQKGKSEELLHNILPQSIVKELKSSGKSIPKYYSESTVCFTDFSGFTVISETMSPEMLVAQLDKMFLEFDNIIDKYGLQRIKTIGDSYMFAGGVPDNLENHAKLCVKAAIEIRDIMERHNHSNPPEKSTWSIRIGLNSGPVVAGIIGVKKFQYDIWGDTVNTASRMESHGEVGMVNISENTYELIKDYTQFTFEHRGKVEARGKGEVDMYFVQNAS